MTYRLLADSGCTDGTCPTFFIEDTGEVRVRGYDPDSGRGAGRVDPGRAVDGVDAERGPVTGDFDALFDTFTHSAYRVEALTVVCDPGGGPVLPGVPRGVAPAGAVGADQSVDAADRSPPRPVRRGRGPGWWTAR
jgi:hypothetical protein